jgi:excinuclease ABC subunit B
VPQFEVVSPFRPAGDQPAAIDALVAGLERGERYQTLEGITGSGKTATIAWVIERVQRPTLIIEPNKSLAAQLSSELKDFFPKNRVEFFVSYYDYYQPEAYVPTTDTYIEKDSSINDEIDRLRHATTSSLLLRRDVVVVASVSCIYGLGSPEEYRERIMAIEVGREYDQRGLLRRLVDLHYDRNDMNLVRGTFRARGDTIEIHPAYEEIALRVEFFGDTVERIVPFDVLTGEMGKEMSDVVVFAATHYVAGDETMKRAIDSIEDELRERLSELNAQDKLLEAQRLTSRTNYDLEMLGETGICAGIENYSRHLDGRGPGDAPYTLLDFFPEDFLVVVDESHVAVPQLHGQYAGDRSRKTTLVEHGFRLPSAMDNRPLRFDEFVDRVPQAIFVSATPGSFELDQSSQVVEQVIRPTGLVDPEVVVKETKGQVDDLLVRIEDAVEKRGRVLVTTLTKKMAEDLTEYLFEAGVRVQYLHSDIDTITRIEILRELRLGSIDVVVGINLLREGLDLPEVSLVAILDADKEGFLRSAPSLIQTMGRAARNVEGSVVLYADKITDSMREAIDVTQRRRAIQTEYNRTHGIDPQTIRKSVTDILERLRGSSERTTADAKRSRASVRSSNAARTVRTRIATGGLGWAPGDAQTIVDPDVRELVSRLEEEMNAAASELRFEEAALIRDEISELRSRGTLEIKDPDVDAG